MTRYMLFVVVTIAFNFHVKSNTTGATSGTWNTYPSGALEFVQVFLVWFVLSILSDTCLHVFIPPPYESFDRIVCRSSLLLFWYVCHVLFVLFVFYLCILASNIISISGGVLVFNCSTTGATCGTGTVCHSEAPGSSYSIVSLLCSISWAMVRPLSFWSLYCLFFSM